MLKGVRTVCTVGALAMALAIAACGDDEESDGGAGRAEPAATTQSDTPAPADAAALQLQAKEQGGLSFDKKELTATAGEVTITMENPSSAQMPHDIAIEGEGVEEKGEVVQPGGTSEVKADLQAGTYTFYCSVGQHRQAGMEGTLTVQ
jgi:plastocyanin